MDNDLLSDFRNLPLIYGIKIKPVYFYIIEGPATVDGNILKFTKIPPRSKFPIIVTVVAWQWGRSAEPKVKTAEPVERSFLIVK